MAEKKSGIIDSVIFNAYITNTSNKVSEEFKNSEPSKACYITYASEDDAKKGEAFGIKGYTSKDGDDYVIVRASRNVDIFVVGEAERVKRLDCRVADDEGNKIPNFKTTDDYPVTMCVIKGEKSKNEFKRIQSILLKSEDDIEVLKAVNPFIGLYGITDTDEATPFDE